MKSSRKIVSVTAAAALVIGISSCAGSTAEGTDNSADTKSPVKVLMISSLTGPIANSAKAQSQGLQAAVDSINEHGGISGRDVALTIVDDQLDPTLGATLLQKELDKGTPDLIWHGSSSSVALAMLPAIQRKKVISISCTAASAINDPKTFPYGFGILPSNALETQAMVGHLKDESVKSVGLLTSDDANGQDTAKAYHAALDEAGITWTNETYAFKDLDMTAQMGRLASNRPDRIITQGYGAAAGYYLKSRARAGVDMPTIGASSLANGTNLGSISGPEDWKNLQLMAYPVMTPHSTNQARDAWTNLFDRLPKIEETAVNYTCGWDALQTYKRAAEQAKSFNSDDVKKALENLLEVPEDKLDTLSFKYIKYSSKSHFPELKPEEAFVITEPGPLVDGIVTPPTH
jgi:ABC-type branched-subunit amino acid transport system substrate-binding protein